MPLQQAPAQLVLDSWSFDLFVLSSADLCGAAMAVYERAGAFVGGMCSRDAVREPRPLVALRSMCRT